MRLRTSRRGVMLGAGVAVLTAVSATGVASSPLLPLIALWVAFAQRAVRRPVPIACGAIVLLVLLSELTGQLGADGAAAAAVVAVMCIALGRLRNPAPASADPAAGGRAPPVVAASSLARVVADVREWCGARGAALWRVDEGRGQGRLVAAAGRRVPNVVGIAGSPLAWVVETGTPLPIEPPPDWADPASQPAAARVPQEALNAAPHLLTLEFERRESLPLAALACAAAVVGSAMDREAERRAHAAERERGEWLVRVLRELPRESEPAGYADRLLDSAMALAGASGAALALWRGDEGEIVRTAGYDGGPEVGDAVDAPGSEIGLAGRARTLIARDSAANNAVPLAHGGERWRMPPRARAAIPLWKGDAVVGVIAVWNAAAPPLSDEGIQMLEAIARVCGAQFDAVSTSDSLRVSAERDALTGLLNRRGFERAFASETARAERYARRLAALAVDVDHFKAVNDSFGHEAGDAVLRAVSTAIQNTIREADTAGRVGGEEFVILLPETGLHAAREAAERIRAAVARLRSSHAGLPCDVRVSIGVATLPECVEVPSRLLAAADDALYLAKRTGRDRVCDAQQAVAAG